MQPAELQFAQRLASQEKGIRERAVRKLRQYLSVKTQRETGGRGRPAAPHGGRAAGGCGARDPGARPCASAPRAPPPADPARRDDEGLAGAPGGAGSGAAGGGRLTRGRAPAPPPRPEGLRGSTCWRESRGADGRAPAARGAGSRAGAVAAVESERGRREVRGRGSPCSGRASGAVSGCGRRRGGASAPGNGCQKRETEAVGAGSGTSGGGRVNRALWFAPDQCEAVGRLRELWTPRAPWVAGLLRRARTSLGLLTASAAAFGVYGADATGPCAGLLGVVLPGRNRRGAPRREKTPF